MIVRVFGLAVLIAVVVAIRVCLAYPSPDYPSVDITPSTVPTAPASFGGAR